jgi:hypothetical protein
MWVSVLVGAQPRKGKTFATRLLALFAALDPQVRLIVVDGKMSPGWDKFRLVAHRMVFGPVPNSRDNDPVEHLLEVLREVKAHILEVNSQKPSVVGRATSAGCSTGTATTTLCGSRSSAARVQLLGIATDLRTLLGHATRASAAPHRKAAA